MFPAAIAGAEWSAGTRGVERAHCVFRTKVSVQLSTASNTSIYSASEFELSLGSVRSGPLYYCQIVHDSPPPNSATVYGVVTYLHLQNLGFRVWGC